MKVPKPLWVGFFALLLNSAYLSAFADPSMFYMGNVLAHVALGLILFPSFIVYLLRRKPALAPLLKLGCAFLFAGAVFGITLLLTGAHRPFRWILYLHIVATVAGCFFVLLHFFKHAWRSKTEGRTHLTARWIGLALFVCLLIPFAGFGVQWRDAEKQGRIANPPSAPLTMEEEGQGAKGPFFPSSIQTNTGNTIPSNFFMTSETCKRCHPDIYEQWFSSAHHFSSFNNQWYRKSIEYMQDVVGTKPSKWCGGCHDHAVILNGMMDTPIKKIVNTPEAQAGLACTSCHSIVHVGSTMGQGDFTIEYPPLHDLAASENKFMQKLHDFLVFTDPEPHKKVFMKPFIRNDTAKYCSACHKVHLDVPVNSYRWLRGFNEYDNWQASGVSGQGARAFYYPAKPMKCADCHMPLVSAKDPAAVDGKVHSHRFPGANTALPYVNRDAVQLKVTEDFLKDGQVTVDIFGFGRVPREAYARHAQGAHAEGPRPASTFAVGEESIAFGASQAVIRPAMKVTAPLKTIDAAVVRGDSIRVEVVVRTRKVGHFFPGGTVDAFDVWLELQAVDDRGRVIFWSGNVEDQRKGPVDKGAHFYRSLLIDAHGNRINKRNAWAARSVAYIRLIPPGAADTAHFRLVIPEDCGDTITLKAKLNYRKFAWWNTQWAFAGVRDPLQKTFGLSPHFDDGRWIFTGDTSTVSGAMKSIPDLPIVVMAEDQATVKVVDDESSLPSINRKPNSKDRERWNDYGIGLLLQGDLKGAEAAFLEVTRIDPAYADGWVNIGRARIQEGNNAGAQQVLRRALGIDSNLAKTHFFYAMTLKTEGKYDDALVHLRKAAAQYPLDRVVRNQIGRLLFLQRKYSEAVREFQQTLQIDPEDLTAHYNLMLCYQGMQNRLLAEKERKLYLRFKADEASQEITGPYRRLHPEDNNERQPIHEHASDGTF